MIARPRRAALLALLAGGTTLAPLAAAVAGAGATAEVERFSGVARGRDGAVAYLEDHELWRGPDGREEAVTTYRTPAGEVLAVLRSDFTRDPFAPGYRFEPRRGAVEAVERTAAGVALVAGERRKEVRPAGGRPLVAGQGLDRLVRARLAGLARGEVLRVDFAFPSRQATYPFTVRALPRAEGATSLPVRVELDSWVLRLFADVIDCEYDLATGRLVRYRGPTNLEDGRGDHPVVTITYAYPVAGGAGEEEGRHASR